MGRKERRLAERRNRIETRKEQILVTREELSEMKRKISKQASEFGVEALMTCFALAEHRKHGFGAKRIAKSLEYVDELMGRILNDEATMDDYIAELEKETGIVVKCEDE